MQQCDVCSRILIEVDEYELEVAKFLTRRPWSYSCTGNDTWSCPYRGVLFNAIFIFFIFRKMFIKLKGKIEVCLELDIFLFLFQCMKRAMPMTRFLVYSWVPVRWTLLFRYLSQKSILLEKNLIFYFNHSGKSPS